MGVTFIEMMVTLSLVAIIAACIWPSFTSLETTAEFKRLKLTTAQVLATAHESALASGLLVKVCLSDDGMHCLPAGRKYWLIMAENQRLSVVALNAKRVRIHWRALGEQQGGILFSPDWVANASVWACVPGQPLSSWVLSVNRLGLVREGRAVLSCKAS